MNKIIKVLIIVAIAVSFNAPMIYAAPGANEKAFEHADDKAIFNRTGDWFATIGKSDAEKIKIKAERRAKRAAKRAEKKANKAQKEIKDKINKGKKNMDKKMDKGSSKKGS